MNISDELACKYEIEVVPCEGISREDWIMFDDEVFVGVVLRISASL